MTSKEGIISGRGFAVRVIEGTLKLPKGDIVRGVRKVVTLSVESVIGKWARIEHEGWGDK